MTKNRFTLKLLGPAEIHDNLLGAPLPFPKSGIALLGYLSLEANSRPVSRQKAAYLLWESADPSRARAHLRSLISRIRKIEKGSGLRAIETAGDRLQIDRHLVSDVTDLLDASDEEIRHDVAAYCERYAGELMEDHSFDATLGDIIQWHRIRIRDCFAKALKTFISANTGQQGFEVAARQLLAIDPYHEATYCALMRQLAAAGQWSDLDDVFRRYRIVCEAEMGVELSASVAALYNSLKPAGNRDSLSLNRPAGGERAVAPDPSSPEPSPLNAALRASGKPKLCILMPQSTLAADLNGVATALFEDITISLCGQASFTLIAPYSIRQFGASAHQEKFIRMFAVDYALESRIGRRPDGAYLSATLIDTRTREILWAERFDFDPAAMVATGGSIRQHIARSLVASVDEAELARNARDAGPPAYHSYLKGLRSLIKMDLPDVRAARSWFRASMKQDGDFSQAFSAYAYTLIMEWLLLARGDPDLLDTAEEFSRKALLIDPSEAEGLRELGLCNLYRGRFDESLAAFQAAQRKFPQHADLIADHADALSLCGQPDTARDKIEAAISLNPIPPDRYYWYQATIMYQLHDYETAITALANMRDETPAERLMAASLAMAGRDAEARKYASRVLQTYPDFRVDLWLSMIPIRDPVLKDHYREGLNKAGFA